MFPVAKGSEPDFLLRSLKLFCSRLKRNNEAFLCYSMQLIIYIINEHTEYAGGSPIPNSKRDFPNKHVRNPLQPF